MAEKEKKQPEKEKKPMKQASDAKVPFKGHEEEHETLVRILGYDIPGSRNLYAGLTRIKGVSWTISNAIILKLGLKKERKISELSKDEIQKIEQFIKTMPLPTFLINRRNDFETGETKHYYGSDLDIKREFDIKRLKEIKSYRGIRHIAKLPVRGQRTKSHFRTKTVAMGLKKAKKENKK